MKAMLLPVLMSEMKLFFPFKCNLTENQHWPTVLFHNPDHRKHQITVNYGSLMSLQGQVTNFYTVLYGTRTTERCNYRLITQSFLDFYLTLYTDSLCSTASSSYTAQAATPFLLCLQLIHACI